MFSIIEEHYNEVTLKIKARQISSINIDALLNSVHNTFHYAVVIGDTPFLTSEILSLRVCKSVEHARNTFLLKLTIKRNQKQTDWRTGWPRNVTTNFVIFGKVSTAECTVESRPHIHVFIIWRSQPNLQ